MPSNANGSWPPEPSLHGLISPQRSRIKEWVDSVTGRRAISSTAAIAVGDNAVAATASDGTCAVVVGTIIPSTQPQRILEAYFDSGLDSIRFLNGTAAFYIWDARRKSHLLIRHPGGVPTIFYRERGESVEWATRLDALVDRSDEMDPTTAIQFLLSGRVMTPYSMVGGIRRLVPGTALVIEGPTRSIVDLAPRVPLVRDRTPTIEEVTEDLEARLSASIDDWLSTTDRNPAILMSGGIDSVGLAAAITRSKDINITAYTVEFEGYRGFLNEYDDAHKVASHLGITHTKLHFQPSFIKDHMDWMLAWYGEPFCYALHTAQLSEIVDHGHQMVFAGTGPDGWYPEESVRRWHPLIGALPKPLSRALASATSRLTALPKVGGLHKVLVKTLMTDVEYAIADFGPRAEAEELSRLVPDADLIRAARDRTVDYVDSVARCVAEADRSTFAAHVETLYRSPDNAALWMYQWTEAYGLRSAMPYLNPSLLRYVTRLANLRPDKGEFRELARRSLPRDLAYNKKVGQGVPLESWFRGPLQEFLRERADEVHILGESFSQAAVDSLVDDHISGKADNRWILWKMISLTTWKSLFDGMVKRAPRRPEFY